MIVLFQTEESVGKRCRTGLRGLNLEKRAVFVAEKAAVAIQAKALRKKALALFRLVLIVRNLLLLLDHFRVSVGELAFGPVAAVGGLDPVFAHFGLVLGLVRFLLR